MKFLSEFLLQAEGASKQKGSFSKQAKLLITLHKIQIHLSLHSGQIQKNTKNTWNQIIKTFSAGLLHLQEAQFFYQHQNYRTVHQAAVQNLKVVYYQGIALG